MTEAEIHKLLVEKQSELEFVRYSLKKEIFLENQPMIDCTLRIIAKLEKEIDLIKQKSGLCQSSDT